MGNKGRYHALTLAASALLLTPFEVGAEATVQAEAKHDISPALRDIPSSTLRAATFTRREHRVKKLPPRPPRARAAGTPLPQASVQATATVPLKATKATAFEGIGDGNVQVSSDPPDTNGSVGTTQYVEWVNTSLAVFEKATGKMVFGPADGNTLWRGFGGNCETFNDGDPIVLYDKQANRWFLSQFAVSGHPFSQCIAVSTTPDATGAYARYEFQFDEFNDYGKFGVWPDAYYGAFNMFHDNSFLGAKTCAFERAKMLAGEGARMQCFDVANNGGLLPSDLDGATPPPAGSPNYYAAFADDELSLWKFHVDWVTPASSTLTGPQSVATAPFDIACDSCVVQPPPGTTLDTLSDRLMFRLAYRHFADHESLVVNHTVATTKATGVRWYEVRDPGGTPTIHQQGTFAPSSLFRWMGSIATDKMGNMALAYSVSGKSAFPSIRYTGRSAGDAPNTMAAEQTLVTGKGAQKSPDRWGDYSSMSVDPTDDCTLWFTTQYAKETGTFNWHTSIANIRFESCQ